MSEPIPPLIESSASFSRDRAHRYALVRRWSAVGEPLVVIGLNPSTADEVKNDPTVRRCIGYALREGASGLVMLNAFSLRATDPAVMKASREPNRPGNDAAIRRSCRGRRVAVAWGVHGGHRERDETVMRVLTPANATTVCLGVTREGYPKHPLYLRADARFEPYAGRMPR